MTVLKDQFTKIQDAQAVKDALDAKYLEARNEREMALMSPHIRPEHYAQCMTRQMVAVVVDVDGTALIDVLPEESATKPIGATRVAYDADAQTKTVLAVQPIEEAIAADEIAIKGR